MINKYEISLIVLNFYLEAHKGAGFMLDTCTCIKHDSNNFICYIFFFFFFTESIRDTENTAMTSKQVPPLLMHSLPP